MSPTPPQALSPRRSPPSLITLTLLTALAALTLNMILPSLPSMSRDLGARESVVALAVSGYMLVSALFQLALGPLSDHVGRRRVMLAALAFYTVASLGAMLAQDVTTLLACRFVQSVVVAGTVLSSAIIRDQFPASVAAGKLGAIASAMAVAPMLGPMLGGVLDSALGWRAVFGLYTALGLALLLLVWLDMGETRQPGLPGPRLQDWAMLVRSPLYGAYVLCGGFSVCAFYVFVTGVPYVATALWSLSPAQVGVGLGSITGGYMVGAAITARWAPRQGIHQPMLAGRWLSVSVLLLALPMLAWAPSHPLVLFGPTLLVGLGNGLTLPSVNAGAMSVRPDLAGTAAGLASATWLAMGALLSTLTALVIERYTTPISLLMLMGCCALLSWVAGSVAVRLAKHQQLSSNT